MMMTKICVVIFFVIKKLKYKFARNYLNLQTTKNRLIMLVILSPAKIQNFKNSSISRFTLPMFLPRSATLIEQMRKYSLKELVSLLNINYKLAEETYECFVKWSVPFTTKNSKQAVLAYNGEVYKSLNVTDFSDEDFDYLQYHLRIMSGLYGMLRPLDLIQAYRLDVSNKIDLNGTITDLYPFWRSVVTEQLSQDLKEADNRSLIVNLASSEYSKMVDFKQLGAKVVNFEFLQYDPNTNRYKSIVIHIKKARGLMLRFIVKNQISQLNDLQQFSDGGYWYNKKMSSENKMVFVR